MIQGSCKNHPDRTARRRCFSCGAFICATCQIRGLHHYFCSPRCQFRFQFGEFGNNALELLQSLIPFSQLKKKALLSKVIVSALLTLFVLPLLALIAVIYLNFRLHDRIDDIESKLRSFTAAAEQSPPSIVALPAAKLRIIHPAPGTTFTKKNARFEGVADSSAVISVTRNNTVLAATVSKAGRFSFPLIELNKGENNFEMSATNAAGKIVGFEKIVVHYRPVAAPAAAPDFSRGNRSVRQIALTFDGGSNDNSAEPILKILKEQNLLATVFLTGGFIKNFPEMTRQIVAQGHEVGNHLWSHPHLTSFAMNHEHQTLPEVTREFVHEQIKKTAALFEQATGHRMALLWRAPYGEHNEEIRRWAAELGYRHIGWTHGRSVDESLDTMDWVSDTTSSAYRSSNEILQRLLRIADGNGEAANGGIVLMHLGGQRNGDEAYHILPQLINELRAKEYEIVTVSQLLN